MFFDAVGTLLHPATAVADTYAQVGKRFGSRLTSAAIAERFRTAFVREDALDRQLEWRTSEEREHQRWRNIVSATLDDVREPDACFAELFDHFGRPQAWRLAEHAGEVIGQLAARGLVVGMASNYDRRLHSVVAGFGELQQLQYFVVSSEVGYRKPARGFFDAVVRRAGGVPAEIVHVGDDATNDCAAAKAAGLWSVLITGSPSRSAGASASLRDVHKIVSESWRD